MTDGTVRFEEPRAQLPFALIDVTFRTIALEKTVQVHHSLMRELRLNDTALNADYFIRTLFRVRADGDSLDNRSFGLIVGIESNLEMACGAWGDTGVIDHRGRTTAGWMLTRDNERVGAAIADDENMLGFRALLDIVKIVGLFLDLDLSVMLCRIDRSELCGLYRAILQARHERIACCQGRK